jgi:hypothetical protein
MRKINMIIISALMLSVMAFVPGESAGRSNFKLLSFYARGSLFQP